MHAHTQTLTSENVRKTVNKRWTKHFHAIKILEETGREWEGGTANEESVQVV